MINIFNIRDFTERAHNKSGKEFDKSLLKQSIKNKNSIGTAVGKTHLGTPFFMDVTIGKTRLPNEPLLTFSTQKRIVQTVVVGSQNRGTVKELISANDYKIKIEGVCIEPGKREYPTDQVNKIIKLCQLQEALEFKNDLAQLLGIEKIVITGYNLDKMEGQPYSQRYTIDAISDDDFFAELNNRDKPIPK
ncbi:DUF6046 domain-containing protein [uncultured Tenacibaculum sp.]|uniref:DUF6046 domain-containing protein n=1 Tax=uncultured Tenacibaculum sp. TaxID=174713 RepID=UPI002624E9B0|nr:DUF6046 domain-containing protein [uncultured Tenacibaculum sp.]